MRYGFVRLAVVALVAVVAGCGGSGTAVPTAAPPTEAPAAESSSAGNGGSGSGSQPSAETSVAEVASEAPGGGGSGGGGAAVGVCELVSADELAGIFGVASVKSTVFPGPPDNCIVESDGGDPLSAWALTTAQASALFDTFTTDPATIDVSGIGDKAAIVQNTGLMVLKGSSLLVISISSGADMSEDEANEASKQIGTFAAGRL